MIGPRSLTRGPKSPWRAMCRLDRTLTIPYKPRTSAGFPLAEARVAQLVEHATENRSVGGSIPPPGTISPFLNIPLQRSDHLVCDLRC